MIGIAVPVHNEEEHLPQCLASLKIAAGYSDLNGEEVRIVAVLDSCSDRSREIALAFGIEVIEIDARCVGDARAQGALQLLKYGARWLAFTDADTLAAPDWLAQQLALQADVVCGTVEIDDWSRIGETARLRYQAGYTDDENHRHIHGANLGLSARVYMRVGGFPALSAHEDVVLVRRCIARGYNVAWTAKPRVRTSSRLVGRVPEGFSTFLRDLLGGPASPILGV